MTAFNVVRFRVKPGREQQFLDALFTLEGQSETVYSTSTVDTAQAGTTTIDYAVVPARSSCSTPLAMW